MSTALTPDVEAAPVPPNAPSLDTPDVIRRQRLGLLLRSPSFLIGAVILIFWIVMAIAGPFIAPYGSNDTDLLNTLTPPSGDHWFGTDQYGRDVLSRVIVGSRDILIVAPLATLLGTVVGAFLGLLTGYARGLTDDVVSRIMEAFLALPLLIIAMLVITALGISNSTVIIVIGLSFGLVIARHGARRRAERARPRLRGGGESARRKSALHHGRRDSPERPAAPFSWKQPSVSATPSSPSHR